ncbi:MAG: biotin transporter BioY [Bacillota bacterium]|nr:biotin transporter BioY [Bacillota bacterium]
MSTGDSRPGAPARPSGWPGRAARVGLMAALIAALAAFSIPLPFTPVPFTLQIFGVLLAGALLPPAEAVAAVALYIALGAVGLPVFAQGHAGVGVLLGPTGGYLWGDLAGVGLAAWLLQRPGWAGSGLRVYLALLAGLSLTYLGGLLQLRAGWMPSWQAALAAGAWPFLPFDLIKAAVATPVALGVRRALPALQGSPYRAV